MPFSTASLNLKRSSRTRKSTSSEDTDIYSSPCSSLLAGCRKTRPPPLQIIPELSEHVLDISAAYSPATARPTEIVPRQPDIVSSRVTLSAYTFSIDDALLAGDAPRSPALSASSSTSDGASSEDVPATPNTSDNEDTCDLVLHTPRLRPQRVSIRPLCITKARHLIYQEDEEIRHIEAEQEIPLPSTTKGMPEDCTAPLTTTQATEESEHAFYAREFEDFVSFFSTTPSPTFPARRDSLVLVEGALPTVVEVFQPKPCGRSRHSKPLPLLPPATPPASSLPSISSLPLIQTIAQKSAVRRKRNMQLVPNYPPPPTPGARHLPRMSIPLDVEDCVFPEDILNHPFSGPMVNNVGNDEDASIYSRPSFAYTVSTSTHPLPPAIVETPLSDMHGDVILPRSSTDSDAPRSSVDSTPSFSSSMSSDTSFPSLSPPSSPSEDCLRSRWSSSTLGSLAAEPPRAPTLFSPLRGVFSSRTRWVSASHKMSSLSAPSESKTHKSKHGSPSTSSPASSSGKHHRRHGSRSSTSSAGTSSSDCDSHDGSPSRLKRKRIPVAMFLRAP